ncbi:hypothetical protein [Thalassotalea sediminis]|uniref:hypothetical protein n=1 Tax=Thalassotalea sediminis TaxID=1759089 RepID=UPI0025724454|nr:hypothetical protein [Thalassotalea sediminis]
MQYIKQILGFTLLSLFAINASASIITPVDTIESSGLDVWKYGDMRDGGTANIVSLTGLGGNLESNAPLGNDALMLTTGLANNDKAEVGISNDFGLVSDIFNQDLSFSYDYYRTNDPSGNNFAAPALKLGFYKSNCLGDCYFQLIFEPYFNSQLVDEQWQNVQIDLNVGNFWNTGGFGLASGAGGCGSVGCISLADTRTAANIDFEGASLVNVAIGIGTYNQGVTSYVDNVNINVGNFDKTFDFEATEVPEPSTIFIFTIALLTLRFFHRTV